MHNEKNFVEIGKVLKKSNRSSKRAALVIVNDANNRVLLQLRDLNKPIVYPGFWTLFGGAIEQGEKPVDTAIRELREETGLIITPEQLVPVAITNSTDERQEIIYIFSVKLNVINQDICLYEGAGFAFLDKSQVETLKIIPYIYPVIRYFFGMN